MKPEAERELLRGVETHFHFNKHYPDGVLVFSINTNKAKYQGASLYGNAWLKRKFENLLFLNFAGKPLAFQYI